MLKKMMLLAGMALAVIAFAAPAAMAATFTDANGEVEKGDPITAFSSNTEMNTTIANLHCNQIQLEGEVNATGGIDVVGITILNNATVYCPIEGTPGFLIATNRSIEPLDLDGGSGHAGVELGFDVSQEYHCHFEGNVNLSYVATSDTISVLAGSPTDNLTEAGLDNCPFSSLNIHGDFSLSDPDGTVTIH